MRKSSILIIASTLPLSVFAQSGSLEWSAWTGIAGSTVKDLTQNPAFFGAPAVKTLVTRSAGPVNFADTFGQQLAGTITAPVTGNYTFWVSGDETAELWLGTGASRYSIRRIASLTSKTSVESWGQYTSQKSTTISLVAGQTYYLQALGKDATGTDHLAVAWQYTGQTRQVIPSQFLAVAPADPNDADNDGLPDTWQVANGVSGAFADPDNDGLLNIEEYRYGSNPKVAAGVPGYLSRDVWGPITGETVAVLTQSSAFLRAPGFQELWPGIDYPTRSESDQSGQRFRGTLKAPVTGSYTFWIAGDENCELWLGSSASKFQKKRIAFIEGPSDLGMGSAAYKAFDRFASQKSLAVNLVAGTEYYFEVLHKERTGSEHVEVAWQKPGGVREIIPQGQFKSFLKDPNDVDDDDMPDDWERLYGLDATDNGSRSSRQAGHADYDYDGLTNREEYLAGTNPTKADSDLDGFSDLSEVTLGTAPNRADVSFNVATSLAGGDHSAATGQWLNMNGSTVVSACRRGSLDYSFSTAAAGVWGFQVNLQPLGPVSNVTVNVPLEFYVDDVLVATPTMISFGGKAVTVEGLSHRIAPGAHTLRLVSKNPVDAISLQINTVKILQPAGADANADGVVDWVAALTGASSAVVAPPAESLTSPLCLEGRARFASLAKVTASGGTVAVQPQPNAMWFANVPLRTDGAATPISAQPDASQPATALSVRWRALNLCEADNTTMTLRKGDALRLTAFPVGTTAAGTAHITVKKGAETLADATTPATTPLVQRFDAAGTYTVQAVWGTNAPVTLTVQVKEASFGAAPRIAYVKDGQSWTIPGVGPELTLVSDRDLLTVDGTAPATGGRNVSLYALKQGSQYLAARLSPGGPILASGEVRVVNHYDATTTGDTQLLQTFDNGDSLYMSSIVIDALPPGGYARVSIFVSGVTFEDGTTVRDLHAEDFAGDGIAFLVFNMVAGTKTSVCHHVYIYDAEGRQVGLMW